MHRLAIIAFLSSALTLQARTYSPETLPASVHLDTEVVTNVPVSMANAALSAYRLELDFTPCASNCVEVAFGRDADGNGALGLMERGISVGWDCGEWKLACGGGAFVRPCAEDVIGRTNGIVFEVGVKGANARSYTATVGGEPFFDEEEPKPAPDLLFDPAWDMMRLTVRGVERASERVRLTTDINATTIRVR